MMPFLYTGVDDYRGMGDGTAIAGQATQGAEVVGGAFATSAAIAANSAWVPFIGPIVAGVSLLTGWIFGNVAKTHAQDVATTKDVNAIEPYLQANLAAYMSGQIDKATALATFDAYWQKVITLCSDPSMGDPGKRCVSDRQAGACKWKNDGKGGPAGSGNVCWNWFTGYRTPIENGPESMAAGASFLLPPSMALPSVSPIWLLAAGAGLLVLGSKS